MAIKLTIKGVGVNDTGTHIGEADQRKDIFDKVFMQSVLANPETMKVLREKAISPRYDLVEVILVVKGRFHG